MTGDLVKEETFRHEEQSQRHKILKIPLHTLKPPTSGCGGGEEDPNISLPSLNASQAEPPGSLAALTLLQPSLIPNCGCPHCGNYFVSLALPAPRTVSGTQLSAQMSVNCQVMCRGLLRFVGLITMQMRFKAGGEVQRAQRQQDRRAIELTD